MSNAALSRIVSAQAALSAQYLKAGRYRLEVQSIGTKADFKGPSAIAELKVVAAERTQPSSEPSRIGMVASYVENLSYAKKNGGGRLKAFVMARAGAKELSLEQFAKLTGDKQARDFLIDCEVFPKTLPRRTASPRSSSGATAGEPSGPRTTG